MNETPHWERCLYIGLSVGLVLAPLPFGGTPGWFTNAFALTIGALAAAWAFGVFTKPNRAVSGVHALAIPGTLYCIAVAWCFFQATIPVSAEIAHEAWRDTATIMRHGTGAVLSLNPEASIAGALRLSGYGLVFFLSYILATDEFRALRLLTVIALAGAAYALYGIFLEFTGSRHVLWYVRTFEPDNLSATFPNRNAFASYAILCLLCCCTALYRRQVRLEDTTNGWRRMLVSLTRYWLRRNGWALYAVTIVFAAILMTHSRAGLATAVLAFFVFAACATIRAPLKKATVAGSGFIAISAIALIWMLGSATAERLDKIHAASVERLEIYRLTLTAIADRPVLGTGLGTFRDVFPAFRTPSLRARIDYAHNSYLENALEMGVPAAVALYSALAVFLFLFLLALLKRRTIYPYPALGIAVLAATFFHSLFDYAAQFPAVAITFAAILGIAAAQSFSTSPAASQSGIRDRRA